MIVSLTKRQVAALRHFATDRHMSYVERAVVRGKKVDIAMPYAGWASLLRRITDAAYHTWGAAQWNKVVKGPGRATFEVRERIAKRMNEYAGHPAMLGHGVVGVAYEMLVAFDRNEGPPYFAYPPAWDTPLVVLRPRHISAPTLELQGFSFTEPAGITVWERHPRPGPGGEGMFTNRADHQNWP